jgi:hypothetical protein
MSWNTPGVRRLSRFKDQPFSLSNWGNSQLDIGLNPLKASGYLAALEIVIPLTNIAGTLNAGTLALQPAAQLGVLRAIKRIQLQSQGITDLLDLRGDDTYFLQYVNRKQRGLTFSTEYAFGAPPSAPNGGVNLAGIATSQAFASPNGTFSLRLIIPMTMELRLKGTKKPVYQTSGAPLVGQDGKPAWIEGDSSYEISLISLLSRDLSITPYMTVNPLYGPGVNSLLASTGAAVASANVNGYINARVYNVPPAAGDRPLPEQTSLILSRTTATTPVVGGAGIVKFREAGVLLRCSYVAVDANDNYVDLAATPQGSIDFGWGTHVSKFGETVEDNICASLDRLDEIPPQGVLVHDFVSEHEDINDVINTVKLADITTNFSGLPANVAQLRVIEERLIPVTAKPQGA